MRKSTGFFLLKKKKYYGYNIVLRDRILRDDILWNSFWKGRICLINFLNTSLVEWNESEDPLMDF